MNNTFSPERCALGMEFGSTRIKAVLIDEFHRPVASGEHPWENQLINGVFTYSYGQIIEGMQACFCSLKQDVETKTGQPLTSVGAIGISAMMHGYIALDEQNNLLVPFRTWRNTMTEEAAEKLSELFRFNVPQRWSVAHLYQAMLNKEPHLPELKHLTTLSGFIHTLLTGQRVLGVGDASGMMPISPDGQDYDKTMTASMDNLLKEHGLSYRLADILPKVGQAGQQGGHLTAAGAWLLDPSGVLQPGIPFAMPEGDAGTGMVATNSVAPGTGNVSAGTSIFAMIVLEHGLKQVYPEIDMVTTPDGKAVAMVHCNSCTSDLDAWVHLFGQFAEAAGNPMEKSDLYGLLYGLALTGKPDGDGMLSFNYLAGEPITGTTEGRPLFARMPDTKLHLPTFMRVHLYSALATLALGMHILQQEYVQISEIVGHGGLFKTKEVGQRFLAAAIDTPVTVMTTAGEGGAWGMALLAAYAIRDDALSLPDWLSRHVFRNIEQTTIDPVPTDVAGLAKYLARYADAVPMEQAAIQTMQLNKA